MDMVDAPTIDSEWAIRNRTDQSLFGDNEHKFDMNIPTGISGNSLGLYGVEADDEDTRGYRSYNTIISNVHETFVTALKCVFKLYQAYIKFKSIDTTKYSEAENEYKDQLDKNPYTLLNQATRYGVTKQIASKITDRKDCSDSKFDDFGFREFFEMYKANFPNTDICFALIKDFYIEEIAKLRFNLEQSPMAHGLRFNIENTTEFPENGKIYVAPNVKFKVRPRLISVIKSTTNDTLPNCEYKILLDFNSIVDCIVRSWSLKVPDQLPEGQIAGENDIDEFVNQQLVNMGNLAEKVTRKICLELIDVSHNVKGNWCHFVNKYMCSYDKLIDKNDAIINLERKLDYLLKEERQTSITTSKHEILSNIYEYINTGNCDVDNFIIHMNNASSDEGKEYEHMAAVMFLKAFMHHFEDAVELVVNSTTGNIWSIYDYSREFNRVYNYDDLLSHVNRISDYITRDFYITIINESRKMYLCNTDDRKLKNGENAGFIYSKLKRNVITQLAASLLVVNDLDKKRSLLTLEKFNNSSEKIKRRVITDIQYFTKNILNSIKYICNESGVVLTHHYFNTISEVPNITDMFRYCENYTNISARNRSGFNTAFGTILKTYMKNALIGNDTERCDCQENIGRITSYDSVDLACRYAGCRSVTGCGCDMFNSIISRLCQEGIYDDVINGWD